MFKIEDTLNELLELNELNPQDRNRRRYIALMNRVRWQVSTGKLNKDDIYAILYKDKSKEINEMFSEYEGQINRDINKQNNVL